MCYKTTMTNGKIYNWCPPGQRFFNVYESFVRPSSFAFLLEDVPNSTHLEACHTRDSRKRCSKILCKKKGNKGKFLRFLVGFSFGLLFNFNKLLATLRGLKNFSCTVELNQAAHTDIYLA